MKLVLYSGGSGRENQALGAEVAELLQAKKQPVITFVPADGADAAPDFRSFQRIFAHTGLKHFRCTPIDQPLSLAEEKALFASDAIFLGGGNTFYFLHHLRERKLLQKFRRFVKRGGVLMGLSAGSILMTPSVKTAEVPSLDSDENEVGLRDLEALGLVPFEFSPHYCAERQADAELLAHSQQVRHPIYACADGEGIVVRDGSIRFVGPVTVFHGGHKYTLQ